MKIRNPVDKGFTLIELLVVVSIISILALIAMPNYADAVTRAKVAAVKNNMRATATRFEMFNVDTNRYPLAARWTWVLLWRVPDWESGSDMRARFRHTYSYMYGRPEDLFANEIFKRRHYQDYQWLATEDNRQLANGFGFFQTQSVFDSMDNGAYWQNMDRSNWERLKELAGAWALHSPGPDLIEDSPSWVYTDMDGMVGDHEHPHEYNEKGLFHEYDPSNGTRSYGNIFRTQRSAGGLGTDPQYY